MSRVGAFLQQVGSSIEQKIVKLRGRVSWLHPEDFHRHPDAALIGWCRADTVTGVRLVRRVVQ